MKYYIVLMLMFIISCSTPSKPCNYNDCNDCSQMSTWKKDLLSNGDGYGSASKSSGIRNDRKVRVLAVSSSLKIPMQSNVAKSNAKKIAIDEARRHITKLINLEISHSQHAPGMHGIEILYRGHSYAGENGIKLFSDTMNKILDDGNLICLEYDIENRRCIVLMEFDLKHFDK